MLLGDSSKSPLQKQILTSLKVIQLLSTLVNNCIIKIILSDGSISLFAT